MLPPPGRWLLSRGKTSRSSASAKSAAICVRFSKHVPVEGPSTATPAIPRCARNDKSGLASRRAPNGLEKCRGVLHAEQQRESVSCRQYHDPRWICHEQQPLPAVAQSKPAGLIARQPNPFVRSVGRNSETFRRSTTRAWATSRFGHGIVRPYGVRRIASPSREISYYVARLAYTT